MRSPTRKTGLKGTPQMKKSIVPLLLALCILAGCGAGGDSSLASPPASGLNSSYVFAMDTYMELTVYGDAELLDEAEELIRDIEGKLSVTDENSEIYAINHNGGGTVSEDTAAVLNQSLQLCERTGGALDISIYPIVRTWGFTSGDYRVPEDREIEALLQNVDYRSIDFDGVSSVTLPEGTEIDLGSVAKGYTSGRIIDLFRENGVTSALLNLGGNVHALGTKPDGSPWRVAIQNPLGQGNLCVLEIDNRAVITSGGYERYFEQDGSTYWHIIDPSTGAPASSGLISVTIVGENGLLCDGLSTSLFVMGLEKASQLWAESDDFEAVFVTDDGKIYITEGLESGFTTADDYTGAEVTVIHRD